MMSRLDKIKHLYDILNELEAQLGGMRYLANCHGKMNWPERGIYFFFEPGEERSTSGSGLRVVRVGTHTLKLDSQTTLWDRLLAHRGYIGGKWPDGGNNRGSVFRYHVGCAILAKDRLEERYLKWGVGSSASSEIRNQEYPIEKMVSQRIRAMPFLWLEVDDSPGPKSRRAYLERNLIALLSNYGKLGTNEAIDPPSKKWLGNYSTNDKVRKSGLWNDHHVDEPWDSKCLEELEARVKNI